MEVTAVLWRRQPRGDLAPILVVGAMVILFALLPSTVDADPRPHAYTSNTTSSTDTLSMVATDSETLTESESASATDTMTPSADSRSWSLSDEPTMTATSSESPSDPTPTRGSTSVTATDAESFSTTLSQVPSRTPSPTGDETASESLSASARTHTPSRSIESVTETADESFTDSVSYSYIPPTPTPPDTRTESATDSGPTRSVSATRRPSRSSSRSATGSRWAHTQTSHALSPTPTIASRTSSGSAVAGPTHTMLPTHTRRPTPTTTARTPTPTTTHGKMSSSADASDSIGSMSDTRPRSLSATASRATTTSRSVVATRSRTYYVPPVTPVPPTPGPTDAPPIWEVAASVRLSGDAWGLILADAVATARLGRAVVLDVTAMIVAAQLGVLLHPSVAEGVRVTSLTEGSLIANVTIAVVGTLDDVVAVRDSLVAGFATVPLTTIIPSTWLFYQSETRAAGVPNVAALTMVQPGRFVIIAPPGGPTPNMTAAANATVAPASVVPDDDDGFACDLWFCGVFIIFVVVCFLCVCAVVVYLCTRRAGDGATHPEEHAGRSKKQQQAAAAPSDRPEPIRRDAVDTEKDSAPLPPPPPPPAFAGPPPVKRAKSFDSSPNPIAMREATDSYAIMTPTPGEFQPVAPADDDDDDDELRTPSFLRPTHANSVQRDHRSGWQGYHAYDQHEVVPPAIYDPRAAAGAMPSSPPTAASRAPSSARFLPASPSPERPREPVHQRQFSYTSAVSQFTDDAEVAAPRQQQPAGSPGRQRGLVLSPPPPARNGPTAASDTTEIIDVLTMTPNDPFSLGEPSVDVPMTPVTGPRPRPVATAGDSAASVIVIDESE